MEPSFDYVKAQRQVAQERYLVFDIETVGRDNVGGFIPEPEAAGTIKDPKKIAADIEKKRIAQLDKIGLDMNLNRIVALGVKHAQLRDPLVYICKNEDDERIALAMLWNQYHPTYDVKNKLVGFHCKGFDVPVCVRRTQLLGLPTPLLDTGRYSKDVIDLHEVLTFGIFQESGVMKRNLKNFCDLFELPTYDDCDGADIAELVAAEKWDEVKKHCAADVMRTEALALRLGVI